MKKYPVFLVFLPLFFTLYHYNQLFGFLSLWHTVLMFLIVLGAAAISYLLFFVFIRSKFKAALAAFFLLFFVLYFGPYHDFVKSATNHSAISRYLVIVPVTLIILGALAWYLFRKKDALLKFAGYLDILLLILCVLEVGRIGLNIYRVSKDHNLLYPGKPICNTYTPTTLPDSAKPDIYLLIFDEYTNNNTLKKIWNFDNSDITNYLQQQGFYVPQHSIANYNFTPFSLSSLMNLNYIGPDGTRADIAINRLKGIKSMSDNEALCMLEKEQYTLRFITPFENRVGKTDIKDPFALFAERYIYGLTFPGRFKTDLAWNFRPTGEDQISKNELLAKKQFEKVKGDALRTTNAIKSTTDSTVNRKPQFVYGHYMITHKPHYFDSAGNQLPLNMPDRFELFKTYTQQIQNANTVIKELADHIKRTNKKNTIIIIQSDHGFREFTNDKLALHYPNFCSIYFPGGDYSSLYDNMSLVNEFRIVFNRYFNQRLPLLKDSMVNVRLY